jgi:hypothetical protein
MRTNAARRVRVRATTGESRRGRCAGLDRATVGPSLLVLALAVLMSVVLPSIDRAAPYGHSIHRGDTAEVADGITLVPAAGWDLASGALVGHARSLLGNTATTELVDGSVNFDVQAAPFAGTPSALLARVRKISAELNHTRGGGTATHSYAVTTRQGAIGVGQDFVGISRQGSVVAFVFRVRGLNTGEGVELVVSGPQGTMTRERGAVIAMIRSIRTAS